MIVISHIELRKNYLVYEFSLTLYTRFTIMKAHWIIIYNIYELLQLTSISIIKVQSMIQRVEIDAKVYGKEGHQEKVGSHLWAKSQE